MIKQETGLPWCAWIGREGEHRGAIRVAVIGDLILDEYLEGHVDRISPEAPVPVHLVNGTKISAGGAANVARNIHHAGGEVRLLGVLGQDDAGSRLKALLENDGIDTRYIVESSDRPTIRKTRVTANRQQMVRIDWEKPSPISAQLRERLLGILKEICCDVILLSDYAKGCLSREFIQEVIVLARSRGVPVFVDPKGKDYSRYKGAALITPNRSEAIEALGLDTMESYNPLDLAQSLRSRYGLDKVIVTLGEEGMVGVGDEQESVKLEAVTREVFDVSGAGDTVVAILALAMGAGESLAEAMRCSNFAAGLVVEKWGTQPVYAAELALVLASGRQEGGSAYRSSTYKIVSASQLKSFIGPKDKRSKKVVFTNGCFDLIHAGHVSYLEAARGLGDALIVAVNSDQSIRGLKGQSRPIVPEDQRLAVIAGLGCVDYVVLFDKQTPRELIQELEPDVLVKGADYQLDEIAGAESVMQSGGSVKRIPFLEGLSTTDIIKKVKALD